MEDNITRIQYNDKELILVGTAHVSKRSAEEVKEVIEQEQPDAVCVELDNQRYKTIINGNQWKDTDIFKIIKQKKASLLLINLIISSFQRKIANKFGINPGQEMIQGIESAKEIGADLVLADRNIQVTFQRIWRGISFFNKMRLLTEIIASLFVGDDITEEDLEELKSKDMLESMLTQFSDSFPQLKKPLIDERDQYLAQKIKTAPGKKIVAILGAAHVPGITEQIKYDHDLAELSQVPPKAKWSRIIPWLIPISLIAIIVYTFFVNRDIGIQQATRWIVWNGSFAGLGALLAWSHPLTIITAFIIAPISSLNPLIASGWFAGLVEAVIRKPKVRDFEALTEDVTSVKGFWENKVSRILLIIVLTNLGSTMGTFVGGVDVIRLFLGTV